MLEFLKLGLMNLFHKEDIQEGDILFSPASWSLLYYLSPLSSALLPPVRLSSQSSTCADWAPPPGIYYYASKTSFLRQKCAKKIRLLPKPCTLELFSGFYLRHTWGGNKVTPYPVHHHSTVDFKLPTGKWRCMCVEWITWLGASCRDMLLIYAVTWFKGQKHTSFN